MPPIFNARCKCLKVQQFQNAAKGGSTRRTGSTYRKYGSIVNRSKSQTLFLQTIYEPAQWH